MTTCLKIYISGPITGQPDGNRQAFYQAEQQIEELSHQAINPHRICKYLGAHAKWEAYMRECIANLIDCDAIVMLDGWEQSKGATVEYDLARLLGLTVYPSISCIPPF